MDWFKTPIRLATPEEVERIRPASDLGINTNVLAFGNNLAVLRNCMEIDPVYFDENASKNERVLFLWALEQRLAGVGVPAFYFNVPTAESSASFKESVERLGAVTVSTGPEYRYKKAIL